MHCGEFEDLIANLVNSVKPTHATGSNQINCPKCNKKTDAIQNYVYVNAPPFIAFGVNRWKIDYARGRRVKLKSR